MSCMDWSNPSDKIYFFNNITISFIFIFESYYVLYCLFFSAC